MVIWFLILSFIIHLGMFIPFEKKENEVIPLMNKGEQVTLNVISEKRKLKKNNQKKEKKSLVKKIASKKSGIKKGVKKYAFTPSYPKLALLEGIQGKVAVRVKVNTQGQVQGVSLITSSGYEILDQSALEQIQQARFNSDAPEFNLVVNFKIN